MKKKLCVFYSILVASLGFAAVGCGAQVPSSNSSGQSSKPTVTIGYANWAEDEAVSNLWKVILEDKGYHVNLVEADEGTIFQGIVKGNIDLFLDTWLPSDNIYPNKYKSQLYEISNWYTGQALEGLAIPSYVTQVNSYSDLEKNSSMFNNQIIANDPGAGNVVLTKNTVMPKYNLTNFTLVVSSEAAMVSALQRAYEVQKPVVITAWSPHWIFAKYNLKFLPDPLNLYGGESKLTSFSNPDFTKQNPTVVQWFKNWKMSATQLDTLEVYIFHDKMSDTDAAKKWISENQNVVNQWLTKSP